MKKSENDFESFITKRFLEFYNKDKSTHFEICEKSDEKERNAPTFDYFCIDKTIKTEMAIEIKRLFSSNKTHISRIQNWVKREIEIPLKGKIKGEYILLIRGYDSPFRTNRRERIALLKSIREEVQYVEELGESYQLKGHKQISLLRYSEEGSSISAWPVDFSHADDEEIVRILDSSLKKFEGQGNHEGTNIVLLVELSTVARRSEIVSIIKQLEHGFEPSNYNAVKRDFSSIKGIYHIGIHRKTVIAQVGPNDRIMETGFFKPSEFMEMNEFNQWIRENLL